MIDLSELIDQFRKLNNLTKYHDNYIVNNDTQVGIEFCYEKMEAEIEKLNKEIESLECELQDIVESVLIREVRDEL